MKKELFEAIYEESKTSKIKKNIFNEVQKMNEMTGTDLAKKIVPFLEKAVLDPRKEMSGLVKRLGLVAQVGQSELGIEDGMSLNQILNTAINLCTRCKPADAKAFLLKHKKMLGEQMNKNFGVALDLASNGDRAPAAYFQRANFATH